jgi:hypothetical protein
MIGMNVQNVKEDSILKKHTRYIKRISANRGN